MGREKKGRIEGGEGGREKKKEREKRIKVAFWNVVGLGSKDRDFWKRLEE